MIRKSILLSLCMFLMSGALLCGCSSGEPAAEGSSADAPVAASSSAGKAQAAKASSKTSSKQQGKGSAKKSGKVRSNKPKVLEPEASGTETYGNEFASIDASNASEGYFMVKYTGTNKKVKLRVRGPKESEYIYLLSGSGEYETFPLPCGNGKYEVHIMENVTGDQYALACSADFDVTIKDKFKPFLYPNQYANFTKDSKVIDLGKELAEGAYSDLDVIDNVYHYVTENIRYDDEKAVTVQYGYLPDVDDTVKTKKGICFDYAAVMTSILRSQGIPTRLEVGYSGEAYHAWISTFVKDVGWIDKIIEFDGKAWTLMDPTLAANNSNSSVAEYIGDGSNYVLKFSY
ncbi:transglutaminase-like domain-containing protein [Lachnospiraceae bacterium 29-84]